MDSDRENQATTASEDNLSSNSSESSVDTQRDFSELSVDELKSRLKEAGLPVSGKKADLVERLESSSSKSSADESEESSNETDSDKDSDKTAINQVLSPEELEQLSSSELRKIRKDTIRKLKSCE